MTLALIALTIVGFAWQLTLDGGPEPGSLGVSQRDAKTVEYGVTPFRLTHSGGNCLLIPASLDGPALVRCTTASAPDQGQVEDQAAWPLTLLTSTFMHGGFWAIQLSVLFLWIFGPSVEDAMGRLGFLAFYLAAGAVSAYGQSAIHPDSGVPFIGAAGAVAAVIGAYLVLRPRGRVVALLLIPLLMSVVEIRATIVAAAWLGLQLLPGVGGAASPNNLGDEVVYLAPFAGFLFGLAVAAVLRSRLQDSDAAAPAY